MTLQTTTQTASALTFSDLSLNTPLLKALTKSGYTTPTPIQAQAIPLALAGSDLLLSAQTGSGKTASFVLPILHKLSQKNPVDKHIQALILTPTRELALQVYDSVRRYGANIRGLFGVALVGGAPYGEQIRALKKGVQIVVATPGRLLDHINDGRVDLSKLEMLVLDEADRMLDMGFLDDINAIAEKAPGARQSILSSATWDGPVGRVAEAFTNNPQKIAIKVETAHIDESVYYCDDFHHKNKLLLTLLSDDNINQAVIFTATKRSSEQLADSLEQAGLSARYLHGDLPQGKRNRIIKDIKNNKCKLLVATDVAARGIDISAISHVVNYDLPRQVEDYVHRIGRCGRAGRTGVAMNLCSMDDRRQLYHIKHYLKRDIKEAVVDGLEPKRNIADRHKKDERKDSKGGRGRGKFAGAEGKPQTARRSRFKDESAHHAHHDKPKGGFDRRETLENHENRDKRFAQRSDKRFAKASERTFDKSKTDKIKAFDSSFGGLSDKSFAKPFKRFDDQKAFDQKSFDKKPFDKKSFDKPRAFGKKQGDTTYSADGKKPQKGEKPSQKLYSGTVARPKKRVHEQIFAGKAGGKFDGKSGRRFGDL